MIGKTRADPEVQVAVAEAERKLLKQEAILHWPWYTLRAELKLPVKIKITNAFIY